LQAPPENLPTKNRGYFNRLKDYVRAWLGRPVRIVRHSENVARAGQSVEINPVKSESRQLDEKRAYPANLCPLSCGIEFAGFGEDLDQPIGDLIEAMSARVARQRATEHLNSVLSEE
jgi:hypothetical protein